MPLSHMQRCEEALESAQAAVEYASTEGAIIPKRRAQLALAYAQLEDDRYPEARAVLVSSLHSAIADRDELTARVDELMMGRVFWALGRLDTAARWFRDAASGAELRGPASVRSPALAFLTVIACEQGDLETAASLRARFDVGYATDDATTALADAWLARLEGRTDDAVRILLDRVDQYVLHGANFPAASMLHHVVRFGAREHTAHAADRLEALRALVPSRGVSLRARHARAEASADASGLRAVGAEWEGLGALLFAAEAFASAGQSARGGGNGREASADLQRAASLAASCEGARTPLLSFADGSEPLTPREREVASLAAQGLSSNEIAQRLFLSPRTVNNHLQSTYTKLGIRGRHELQL